MSDKTIYFAIRDDDTNYFTRPEDLESCYGKIWEVCPVSLSVVPFHACTKSGAVPKKYWSGSEMFALEKNKDLVAFLRDGISRGRIHITLHGYHHRDEPDGYEFDTGSDLERKVLEGKTYLEQLFDQEIRIFVPPHNTLSRAGYKAVLKAGMDISGIQTFRPSFRGWGLRLAALGIKRRISRSISGNTDARFITFPDGHRELPYHCLTPGTTLQKLIQNFNQVRRKSGVFCLATHYWEFDKAMENGSGTLRTVLDAFWNHVVNSRQNVAFVTLSELACVDNLTIK